MNKPSIKFALGVLLTVWSCQAMGENDSGKLVKASVSQKVASGDVQGLSAMMPALETLWQEDPEAYLQAIKQAVPVLRTSSNPAVTKTVLDTFANVLGTRSPADVVTATSYFKLKTSIITDYCNLEEVRLNKDRLLMIADSLGEVRSWMIPGYQNRGTNQPGRDILIKAGVQEARDLTDVTLKAAYDKTIKENADDAKMNALQLALFSANGTLTFLLDGYAEAFPARIQENRDFLQELATRAKLSSEEQKKLEARR